MECSYYLVIAFFNNNGLTWTSEHQVNSEEIDVNNKEDLIAAFPEHEMERKHLVKLLLVANSLEGGPRVVGDWG